MKTVGIYRPTPPRNGLEPLVGRADRTLDTRLVLEQWYRMGQFYASLETGHTTASVALKRLAGYTAQNRFYRTNHDLGRVFKTEFILHYMAQPQLRTRIRRGLPKIEQLHALARPVTWYCFGLAGQIDRLAPSIPVLYFCSSILRRCTNPSASNW
ncbi:MAG: Tn3 family transposase [Candidatus Latescibacteria bacterium]|nr:Tn3 family transposase [Candidatus Latescibacterota bacterium]